MIWVNFSWNKKTPIIFSRKQIKSNLYPGILAESALLGVLHISLLMQFPTENWRNPCFIILIKSGYKANEVFFFFDDQSESLWKTFEEYNS